MDSGIKFSSLGYLLTRWLSDFLVGRVIQVKVDGFLSSKIYPKAGVPQGSVLSPLLFLIYVSGMPDPKHHLNPKSQFAEDTGLWARSEKAFLAANRLQRDLDALAEWCAKWRIKLNPDKTKLIMFSRTLKETENKPALFLYGIQLSYIPHEKFLGITFDHKFTCKKHFEDILERCQQKYHRIRMLVNQKWGPSPQTILQIYKQCVRPIFEYGVISTITVSDTVITKLQNSKLQNSFIRLALRLPRYISTRLLHETSGLPYVKDRFFAVATGHLRNSSRNPLVEHTINTAMNNDWIHRLTLLTLIKTD